MTATAVNINAHFFEVLQNNEHPSFTLYDDDPVIASFVNMVKGSIDVSVMSYETKLEASKGAGRRKKVNDEEVYKLARIGKSSAEIAELLGCCKSSIDKNEGWRNRKNDDFVF